MGHPAADVSSLEQAKQTKNLKRACLLGEPAIQAPGRMQEYDVQKHKGHLIYAAATPAEGNKRWHAERIVLSKDFPKRVEESIT